MKCYFLRHGIAVEPTDWDGTDFNRPLTADGEERMAREAKGIDALSLELAVILASPLVRARQTAEIVARELQMRDRLIEDPRLGGGFGPASLAEILSEHAKARAIMLVGHEPGMSHTVGELIGGARLDFKKGSLACVNLPDPSVLKGGLMWLASPRLLATTRASRPS